MIHLHRSAPWNPALTTRHRHWYTEVSSRYFKVESDAGRSALWFVYEIDADDDIHQQVANPNAFVAIAFTLAQARTAIQMRLDGKSEDEIRRVMIQTPRTGTGTGRSHPRHVEARRSWRTR